MLLVIGSITAPSLMIFLQKRWFKLRPIFNLAAIASALIFGNIASLAIYDIIKDKTVFMTNIHGLFLNPLFLFTGSYLGVYLVYRMVLWLIEER